MSHRILYVSERSIVHEKLHIKQNYAYPARGFLNAFPDALTHSKFDRAKNESMATMASAELDKNVVRVIHIKHNT